jgi:K+-transporting ATPase A subunit
MYVLAVVTVERLANPHLFTNVAEHLLEIRVLPFVVGIVYGIVFSTPDDCLLLAWLFFCVVVAVFKSCVSFSNSAMVERICILL